MCVSYIVGWKTNERMNAREKKEAEEGKIDWASVQREIEREKKKKEVE